MRSTQKHIVRNIVLTILLIVGCIIIGIVLYASIKEHGRTSRIDELIAQQKSHHDEIVRENKLLEELISYKDTLIAKERAARERGYQEEGEQVIVIKAPENSESAAPAELETEESDDMIESYNAWREVFLSIH